MKTTKLVLLVILSLLLVFVNSEIISGTDKGEVKEAGMVPLSQQLEDSRSAVFFKPAVSTETDSDAPQTTPPATTTGEPNCVTSCPNGEQSCIDTIKAQCGFNIVCLDSCFQDCGDCFTNTCRARLFPACKDDICTDNCATDCDQCKTDACRLRLISHCNEDNACLAKCAPGGTAEPTTTPTPTTTTPTPTPTTTTPTPTPTTTTPTPTPTTTTPTPTPTTTTPTPTPTTTTPAPTTLAPTTPAPITKCEDCTTVECKQRLYGSCKTDTCYDTCATDCSQCKTNTCRKEHRNQCDGDKQCEAKCPDVVEKTCEEKAEVICENDTNKPACIKRVCGKCDVCKCQKDIEKKVVVHKCVPKRKLIPYYIYFGQHTYIAGARAKYLTSVVEKITELRKALVNFRLVLKGLLIKKVIVHSLYKSADAAVIKKKEKLEADVKERKLTIGNIEAEIKKLQAYMKKLGYNKYKATKCISVGSKHICGVIETKKNTYVEDRLFTRVVYTHVNAKIVKISRSDDGTVTYVKKEAHWKETNVKLNKKLRSIILNQAYSLIYAKYKLESVGDKKKSRKFINDNYKSELVAEIRDLLSAAIIKKLGSTQYKPFSKTKTEGLHLTRNIIKLPTESKEIKTSDLKKLLIAEKIEF